MSLNALPSTYTVHSAFIEEESSGHFSLSPCEFMKMAVVHELQGLRKQLSGDWLRHTSGREKLLEYVEVHTLGC